MPHNILYATGLPPEITQVMLSKLFEQYPGFSEVMFYEVGGGRVRVQCQCLLRLEHTSMCLSLKIVTLPSCCMHVTPHVCFLSLEV